MVGTWIECGDRLDGDGSTTRFNCRDFPEDDTCFFRVRISPIEFPETGQNPIAIGLGKSFDVSIIGCGPAGGYLAALLRLSGFKVLVFDDDKRPELLVGESLLPPVVTLMRKLEIEDRVRQFSQDKPGVGFVHRGGLRLDLLFP